MTFGEYTPLAWLLTRPNRSVAMPEWMATTCCNALNYMNIRLTTSSVDTGRLGVKWSRSQERALDEKLNLLLRIVYLRLRPILFTWS
ncbi:hypothetical protein TNCV_266971 [Trichonephila clavipes]|nr:hypothetical protein TNCV_266971 [Trichonephila clavipes]